MSDEGRIQPQMSEDAFSTQRGSSEPCTFGGAVKQGARLGIKWMTVIMGPIAVLGLLWAIGVTVYRLVLVEGLTLFTEPELRWETLKDLGAPFGFYLVCCMWGIVAGELVCPFMYVVKRAKSRRIET